MVVPGSDPGEARSVADGSLLPASSADLDWSCRHAKFEPVLGRDFALGFVYGAAIHTQFTPFVARFGIERRGDTLGVSPQLGIAF